jgi:hypothetical protein
VSAVDTALDAGVGEDDTIGMKGVTRGGIVLGIIGALVGVLIVVAVVLVLQPPDEFDAGTPEATVQGYFQAVIDGNRAEAASLMTPDLVERCGAELVQIRDAPDSFRVVIVETESGDDRSFVNVEITEGAGSGLFGDSYTFDEAIVVERVGDDWLIAEAPWPIYCEEM